MCRFCEPSAAPRPEVTPPSEGGKGRQRRGDRGAVVVAVVKCPQSAPKRLELGQEPCTRVGQGLFRRDALLAAAAQGGTDVNQGRGCEYLSRNNMAAGISEAATRRSKPQSSSVEHRPCEQPGPITLS